MTALNKQKSRLTYRMEKRADVYKLFFYDEIRKYGDFNWETWDYDESETSAEMVKLQLDEIPNGAKIEVHVNSPGGEVGEGVAIYNMLRQKSADGCEIIGYVDGYAYSVAMDITMACDEIHMGLGTSMFLHFPWSVCAGNAEELRAFADQLDALGDASVQLYLARAKNITEEELRGMMAKETCLDPEKCLEFGFCDVIDTYEKKEEKEPPKEKAVNQLKQAVFACQQAKLALEGLQKVEAPQEEPPEDEQKQEPEPAEEPDGEKPAEDSTDDIDQEPKQTMCNTFIEAIRQMNAKN